MSTVIKVENLGKRYILRHEQREKYTALRDVIADGAKGVGRSFGSVFSQSSRTRYPSSQSEDFWALKDVSFEVKHGDRIGIIGRNGAGKSTLLKILSRITEPTEGRLSIKGRVASLLEVGTGFHPELTGRENIYLNGAILGMTRADIMQRFDEIVAFAEVEKFLDTPVKRYSSGMYVRLAFAVAAHVEPEILIVDEVLAVGDMSFQKKCLGKMEEVSGQGRTVLFVSHNMQAVRALCDRGILLSNGLCIADTNVETAISEYTQLVRNTHFGPEISVKDTKVRRGTGKVRFTDIDVVDTEGRNKSSFSLGETIRFVLKYKVFEQIPNLFGSVALRSDKSREIITSVRHLIADGELPSGYEGKFVLEFPNNNLRPRDYPLYFWLGSKDFRPYDVVDDVVAPLTISTDLDEIELGYFASDVPGYFDIHSILTGNSQC